MTRRVFLLISGKRKCGKDYCASQLFDYFSSHNIRTSLLHLSYPLKLHFAIENNLSVAELSTDGPFKEIYRSRMVIWGEQKRQTDPFYFCKLALSDLDKSSEVVIVADCRRPSDLFYFQSNFTESDLILSVRIESSLEVRINRGFIYVDGIDNAETECALDNYPTWDFIISNDVLNCVDLSVICDQVLSSLNK